MSNELLESLKKAIKDYSGEAAEAIARETIKAKLDPLEVLNVLTMTIRQIGDGFSRGELWLPELIGAAGAMQRAMEIVQEEIARTGKKREVVGIVVIGTVFGDIHSIGKTMVASLLAAEGFEVRDLGVNVTVEQFVKAVKQDRPQILAMSALLTSTAPEQRRVISTLERAGLRAEVRVMVGGAAITKEFAKNIGADGFEYSAPSAAKSARALIGV